MAIPQEDGWSFMTDESDEGATNVISNNEVDMDLQYSDSVIMHPHRYNNEYYDQQPGNMGTSRSLIYLYVSLSMSIVTTIFSIIKLSFPIGVDERSIYIGILMSNIALWSPSPAQVNKTTK